MGCAVSSIIMLQAGDAQRRRAIAASAIRDTLADEFDLIVTDPPYYDAIPYSDLMDFFYVWLRRTLHGLSPEFDAAFQEPLAPKWDHDANDGELIDDAAGSAATRRSQRQLTKTACPAPFRRVTRALRPDGRLVIVFAHKQPDAWETLVSAIIRAGFRG